MVRLALVRCGVSARVDSGCGRRWVGGGAEFEDEARAGGLVLFGADGAVVFLEDLGGDGEAEAGAALLGGEVGEEEALAHLVGEAGAGVGDGELDHAGGRASAGGDVELAEEAVLHGFGGVVDEVGEGALEGFGVGEDERQVGARLRTTRMLPGGRRRGRASFRRWC